MPWWKYAANRFLTTVENFFLNARLSEYHTGYRAFSRELVQKLPLENNSDDFLFDNQMLAQIIWFGSSVGEVSCPTSYHPAASSINLSRSLKYGFGCLYTSILFRLSLWNLIHSKIFPPQCSLTDTVRA